MKKILLASLFYLCCSANLFSQSPNWIWAKQATAANNGTNGCASVSSDKAGNAFITGWFDSSTLTFGSTILSNPNYLTSADAYLAKYDANGNPLWAKYIGGTGDEYSYSVCTDDSGNAFIAGWFQSASITIGSFTLTNAGTHDNIFIAKYDPNGNVLWAKSAGGTGYDEACSVCADGSGNVFLTGAFTSTSITFGSTTLNNSSYHHNVFLTKYDASGNVLWAQGAPVASTNGDFSYAVSTDIAGNAFIAGNFCGGSITFGSTTLNNATPFGSVSDIFLVKYDPSGNVIWAKSAGSSGDETAYAIDTDTLGNVYMTGQYGSITLAFGSTTLNNYSGNGSLNVFFVKYDANGNPLWAKDAGGVNIDIGWSVSVSNSKNIYLVGAFHNDTIVFGADTLIRPLSLTYHMFVVKYDDLGNVSCASALASDVDINNGQVYVSADPQGNAFVVGMFAANPFVVGMDSLVPSGEDIFIAKFRADCLQETVSVNELNDEGNISIYPNPSDGIFTLNSKITSGEISVCNVLGEIVFQKKINSSTATIDLSNQTSGIYFVTVWNDKEFFTEKIIVQ